RSLRRIVSHRFLPPRAVVAGERGRRPPLARCRGGLRPRPAHAGARPDGRRGAGADVSGDVEGGLQTALREPGMPIVAITPCKKPRDYEAAVRRAGATPRPLALD